MSRAFAVAVCLGLVCSDELVVDRTSTSKSFDGIGGLSGGGATSRLLPDYAEPSRSRILDYLFKPNFGASLQILKVEIGGDSQSTDGTESSHMHDADTIDLHTGYEWWLMQEAKARNPDIKIYGLAWAFPGWVGNNTGSPFSFPELTARYLVEWVRGAKTEYGLDIDYLGIWNEKSSDSTFVQTLRAALNTAGIQGTQIVVKDGGIDICDELAADQSYADAVDIIGLHYPSDFQDYSVCHSLGKPIWSSEESSSYDDLNGAACWGRIIAAHWVINQMTSNIMWNLVGAYYHGTNWYASSMMTSVEPWSGHYEVNPVIWATAHITQFTEIGWKYLANGSGSGELPAGGYFVTLVDPNSGDFTMNVVKISRDHASCTRPSLPDFDARTEVVTFRLADSMAAPDQLHVWYSNFESFDEDPLLFQHSMVQVVDSQFTLNVPVGAMYTITTLAGGNKGGFDSIPDSSPSFPLPYSENFRSTEESQGPKWLADQIGAFEVHTSSDGHPSLTQMVPELPIGWSDKGSNGPMSLIGMREWQDVSVSVAFKLPQRERRLSSTCSDGAFPVDLTDKHCQGLHHSHASTPDACRQDCCADEFCSVWQWDARTSGSCWTGFVKDLTSEASCPSGFGFLSGGREVPEGAVFDDSACVAARVDQMWHNGVALCITAAGQWNLTNAGPPLQGVRKMAPPVVAAGQAEAIGTGTWNELELVVERASAAGYLNGQVLFEQEVVRDIDSGFAAIGANGWFPTEFRRLAITQSPGGWEQPASCPVASLGSTLTAVPCARNGLSTEDQRWELLPSFQLRNPASNLCAGASQVGQVTLRACNSTDASQLFVNDYTRIRNTVVPMNSHFLNAPLTGTASGEVLVGAGPADWHAWSYFPNTQQLRNQYVADEALGYPMCLSTCSSAILIAVFV